MLNLMKFWLRYLRFKFSWKLSLAFHLEHVSQFFMKFKDQGQFWNLLLVMRILKLSLILRIDKEFTEIFKVEDKGQFQKKEILKTAFH